MASHHGARSGRPARRPAERAAAGERHGHPRAAGRSAPHRQRPQRPLGRRGVVLGRGGHRWRGLDRPVVELPDRLRPHGPALRPLRHSDARGGAQAPLHQQAVERLRSASGSWPTPSSRRCSSTAGCTSPTTRTSSGPNEPDMAFYSPYPCTRRALRRRLFRDAVGISGWKNFVPLVKNTRTKPFRPIGLSIFGVQALLWAPCGPPPGAGGSTRSCGSCPG